MLVLDKFIELEKKQKINYLKQIMGVFEESENLLGDLSKLVKIVSEDDLTDEFLTITYKIIFETLETQKGKIKEQEMEKLQKINKRVEVLRQKEEQEKDNADKLLENL